MLYWEKQLKAKTVPVAKQVSREGFARVELSPAPKTCRTIVRLGGGMAVECEGWPDARWLGELSRTISRAANEVRP
jgi:hypothetical protein